MSCKFGYVLELAEGNVRRQKCPASDFLAARVIMDACLGHDVYLIQLILERLDGLPPSDESMDNYMLQFSDQLNFYLSLDYEDERHNIKDGDTAMAVLAKELLCCAVEPIYAEGKPQAERKREHAAAVKMVMERSGGKKSRTQCAALSDEVVVKEWAKAALPTTEQV